MQQAVTVYSLRCWLLGQGLDRAQVRNALYRFMHGVTTFNLAQGDSLTNLIYPYGGRA